MATHTLGTNANTSLTAVTMSAGSDLADADIATIAQGILDDLLGQSSSGVNARIVQEAFSRKGLLYVPNRGVLKVLPGDVVAVDGTAGVGWPILVSKQAIANGAWHFV